MKGVHCSWVDMMAIRQALAGCKRGDQKRLERMRCVDHSTVSGWRAVCDLLEAVDGKCDVSNISTFQPTHARELARHFRRHRDEWTDDVKDEMAEWVHRCDSEEMTVQELRQALLAAEAGPPSVSCEGKAVERLEDLTDAEEKFGTIYADPPWQYGNQATRASTDKHYQTMTVEEICALPIASLAADEAHLHLWTTNAFLPYAFDVLDSWGFEYKSVFCWVKPQMGIGNYWRVSHEFLVLGVRGDLTFLDHGQSSWLSVERGEHSVKPDCIRELVEKVSPGPRLELFGRQSVNGWTVWGNQVAKTLGLRGSCFKEELA